MKSLAFTRRILLPALCSLGIAALMSCSITEPGDSALKENLPPNTRITTGPKESSTFSYSVTIGWSGEDDDGAISGFNLTVDGNSVLVTNTDSIFAFSAANQDEQHSISVAAVDDKGAVDPTPATLTFTATNAAPNATLSIDGNPAPGATFGRGGVFTIVPEDVDNGPEFSYRFKIDNGAWSEWLANNVIEFSTTSPFGLLPEGAHTFFGQVRDAGQALDQTPAEFPIVVSSTVKPTASISGLFNNLAFYDDRSVFASSSGNNVSFEWSVSFNYAGARSTGSRYRVDGGAWSEYSTEVSSLSLTNVTPGAHKFEVQFRDLAGTESDVALFDYQIVEETLDQGILVVDDGEGILAGRPAATGDANVDAFYNEVLTAVGATYTLWDIKAQGVPTPGRGLGRYSTMIWVSDEAALLELTRQTRLASDYLSLGGNMWIVGWRIIQQIAGATPVPNFEPSAITPASYSFIWNFLKIASTEQTTGTAFDFSGAVGLSGHPDLNLVVAKNPIPNRLGISPVDAFTVRTNVPGAEAIYTFASPNGTSSFQGKVVGMKYLGNDFKVAVFGFPLYHMNNAEATEVVRKMLRDFGEIQ